MKTMRVVSVAGVAVLMSGIFLGLTLLSRAQTQGTSTSPTMPDSVVQIAAEAQGLSLASPDQIPPDRCGTFWIVTGDEFPAPWPYLPARYDLASTPIFSLGPNADFLVDGTGGAAPQPTGDEVVLGLSAATLLQMQGNMVLDFIAQIQTAQANAALAQGQRQMMAMDDSGPPSPGDGDDSGGTNGYSGSSYSIIDFGTNLWVANFALTSNNAAGIVTNTQADVSYEIQYAPSLLATQWSSAGFVLGSELTNWTPMTVTNVSLTNNTVFRIRSWADDGSGLPIWWQLQYFGTTGVDPFGDPEGDGWDNLQKFENGMDPHIFYASPAPPNTNTPPPTLTLVAGPQGYFYVVGSGLPPDLSAIQIFRYSDQSTSGGRTFWPYAGWSEYPMDLPDGSFVILAANITNGIAQIPASEAYSFGDYDFCAAVIRSNGIASATNCLGSVWNAVFVDGRAQLEDNIRFLLRAASEGIPFEANRMIQPTSCVYSGLYDSFLNFDPLAPFEDNYFYRNFDFDANNMITNNIEGIYYEYHIYATFGMPNGVFFGSGWDANNPDQIYYDANLTYAVDFASFITTNSIVAPLSWNASQAKWLFPPVANDFFGGFPAGQNLFGLSYLSELTPYYTNNTFLTETNYPDAPPENPPGGFYFQTAQPDFETVGYYFARVGIDPIPEQGAYLAGSSPTAFSTTNTTPLLIAGVGQSMPQLAGYAKLAVTNGYSGVYAYLGQYFTNAYEINTSGGVTTNSTGILSPYGNFFATDPGPAALMTMPDIDTGAQGTCTVYCVSLVLDKNHDGTMDTSFSGPDNTSQASPDEIWINNGNDATGVGHDINTEGQTNLANYTYGQIRSWRNLENFFRLWLCGLPQLPASQGYTATLSMTAVSGNPAINLYPAYSSDGGTEYLTDTNVAAAQISTAYVLGTLVIAYGTAMTNINANQSYTLPVDSYGNVVFTHFLFEGAGIGEGQLVLTISQNGNTIAQASAWLDLRDVKDMFEEVHITGVTNIPPGNGFLSSSYQQLNWVDSSSDEDTNIIIFVHGWRMGVWDYNSFSQTMFKRLYWQGYRGRFASVRWDTLSADDYQPIPLGRDYFTYNRSEFRAWESAKGVSDYLTNLKQRFPNYSLNVCAHSMGNVVMAEALKLQLAAGQQNVRNYVLMQAALPASCYDTSFTNYAPFLQAEQSQPTPNTYWGYPGSIGVAISGHLVNFYNTNDFALATGSLPIVGGINWEANQENFKPDAGQGYRVDATGTDCYNGFVTITDSREIMSFCARPRSKAVGAQPNVGGAIYMPGQIDLKANYGFNLGSDQHSAQWNWPIQQVSGFYRQLGISLGVFQPSTP